MKSIEVIDLDQKDTWRKLVEETPHKDIHFLPEYLTSLSKHIKASCHLFVYRIDDFYILYPFLKRKITDIDGTYWDISSPWYYGGLLFHGDISKKDVSDFLKEFQNYCNKEHIVTEFSRFHPYLMNHEEIDISDNVQKIGETIWVDLTDDLDDIFTTSFDKRCRTAIRKSEKEGVEVEINDDEEHLKAFHRLYSDSMDAKNARDFYWFTMDFLSDLKRDLGDSFKLITVKYHNKIIAGSIFLYKYDKMYYYLSARSPELDTINASNRIIYEAIKLGQDKNLTTLDIGGGPEGSGLLKFKKCFSKNINELYGYKKIHNEELYKKICLQSGLEKANLKYENASYFPEYRAGE